jgi:hypothetical protein
MRPAKRRSSERKLNVRRLAVARRIQNWEELDPVDLVPRPQGVLVSAETDYAYMRHRGVVWETGSVAPIATPATLYFYEDDDGAPVFLERMPETWSEQVERQAYRDARAAP